MGPLTEQEEWLPEDNKIVVLSREIDANFSKAVDGLKKGTIVNLNWGVKDLDREGVSTWDPEDVGKLIWDENFTMTPKENQQSILDLCTNLKSNKELLKELEEIKCWILDMNELQPANKKLPISDPTEFKQALRNFAFNTEKGRDHAKDYNIGFDKATGELKWMRVVVPTLGKPRDASKNK